MNGFTVHCSMLQLEAKRILAQESISQLSVPFKASLGWCARFLKRHNLGQRCFTSVGQKIPEHAAELVDRTFRFFDEKSIGVKVADIANMDETPVYFDMPGSRTIDMRGIETIKCKTTGHERLRFTTVLTMMADGRKLPPMIIFKGLKRAPAGHFPRGMLVTVASGGSMTADLMETYRQEVWEKRPGGIFKPPSLFIMDTHRAHLCDPVVNAFAKKNRTDILYVPGGMTPVLQPLDVYVNKSFKSNMKTKWME